MTTQIRLSELDDDFMLTDKQVADHLQVEIPTLWYWLRDGRLPASKVGRHWRIRVADLRAYLARTRSGPAPVGG